MISDKAKVLAATAIADKIYILNRRKEECSKWLKEDEADEVSKKFWTATMESIGKNIQEYSDARDEMIKG